MKEEVRSRGIGRRCFSKIVFVLRYHLLQKSERRQSRAARNKLAIAKKDTQQRYIIAFQREESRAGGVGKLTGLLVTTEVGLRGVSATDSGGTANLRTTQLQTEGQEGKQENEASPQIKGPA